MSFRALALACCLLASCASPSERVLRPRFEDGGLLAAATPVSTRSLDGIYGGHSRLGERVVVHSTATTVSLFGERDGSYLIGRAGCLSDQRVVIEGYWRNPLGSDTGLARLFVEPAEVAAALCAGTSFATAPRLEGATGEQELAPTEAARLTFEHAAPPPARPFDVIAHRGGCRTSDDCGASENSVEVIRLAESLGATAVEVDVRSTADGVLVLYHDAELSPRLVQGQYCRGRIDALTWAQLQALCRLSYGERIPSLDEALRAFVDDTELRGLWLDIKDAAIVGRVARAASEAVAESPRKVWITSGLPDRSTFDAFVTSGELGRASCLVELDPADAEKAQCELFAPRWTRGPMSATVAALQAAGRRVAFWTIDEADFIDLFLRETTPDAILTNRPGLLRHRFTLARGTAP